MYIRLLTAADRYVFEDGTPVRTAEQFLGWQAGHLAKRGEAIRTLWAEPIAARVELGRWVVSCQCGVPVLTHPAWGLACCSECGTCYTAVILPPDLEAIAAALLRRPKRENQNWIPGESAGDLERENSEHGIGAAA